MGFFPVLPHIEGTSLPLLPLLLLLVEGRGAGAVGELFFFYTYGIRVLGHNAYLMSGYYTFGLAPHLALGNHMLAY